MADDMARELFDEMNPVEKPRREPPAAVRESTLTRAELRALAGTRKRHFLTPGEWDDVMRLLIEGHTVKDVAKRYGIAGNTIVRRRQELIDQLEAEEAAE